MKRNYATASIGSSLLGLGHYLRTISAVMLITLTSQSVKAQQEVSIDKFTGTAAVSIPLYSLQSGSLNVPFILTHSASGVKVTDDGGVLGVNWSMSAEPYITREVRGLPDDINVSTGTEQRYGWLIPGVANRATHVPLAAETTSACSAEEALAYAELRAFETIAGGVHTMYDSEPDVFSYSVPGYSGRFVLSGQGQVHLLPFTPVKITCNTAPANRQTLSSFTVITPSGNLYQLDIRDKRSTKSSSIGSTAVKYLKRDLSYYSLALEYTTTWRASHATTAAGQRIDFFYRSIEDDGGVPRPYDASQKWYLGNQSSNVPVEEYRIEITDNVNWLVKVQSKDTEVQLPLIASSNSAERFYRPGLKVVALNNLYRPNYEINSITLNYTVVKPTYYDNRPWKDGYGTLLTQHDYLYNSRRLLTSVVSNKNCASTTLYEFGYYGVDNAAGVIKLPPTNCAEQDYWGYYNGNRASTLKPKIYVDPVLNAQVKPGAPYHLYPLNSGYVLDGADRRPARSQSPAGFEQFTLAGTLASITYASGGKTLLEYEAHQVYDPTTAAAQYAGGVRVKSIAVRDPVRQVEQRKSYSYTEADGTTPSGKWLTLPQFAFLNGAPSTQSVGYQQLFAATVRADVNLADIPYEHRTVGYSRVTEQTTGKGRAIHTFSVAVSGNQNTHSSGWSRPLVGLARVSDTGSCPSSNFFRPGKYVYPFAPDPDVSIRQGVIESTLFEGETPAGGYAPVQLTTYAYSYLHMAASPVPAAVTYEQLGSESLFAYARYAVPASEMPVVTAESQTLYDRQRPTQGIAAITRYRYNAQGLLACVASPPVNGKVYRTRYKYAADFISGSGAAAGEYAALRQRATVENITDEPIETISEVIEGNTRRVVGLRLVTFTTAASGKTIPYQIKSWNPATPVSPMPRSAGGYDSTVVSYNSATGKNELVYDSRLRVMSSVLLTDANLSPISTHLTAGNTLQGVHLGYQGTLPVLQITQATADQVIHSDFDAVTDYEFVKSDMMYGVSSDLAWTGRNSYRMEAGSWLSAPLPASGPAAYRLSYWVRTGKRTTPITVAIKQGATTVWQTVPVGGTFGKWVYIEIPVDLSIAGSNRTNYQLVISSDGLAYTDDVTFAPAQAQTQSVTYDLRLGKTSETGTRGLPTFFEYDVAGELRFVRDHNRAIVKQVSQSLPGRNIVEGKSRIEVTGDLLDGKTVLFTANNACVEQAQYTWHFNDPASGTANSATGKTVTHVFNTGDTDKEYVVELTTTTPDGRAVTTQQIIKIQRAITDLNVYICAKGLISVDNCATNPNDEYRYDNGCDNAGVTPGVRTTWYTAVVSAPTCPANTAYNYEWQLAPEDSEAWVTQQNSPSPTLAVDYRWGRGTYRVRCLITAQGCNRTQVTVPMVFNHNGRQGCQ